MNKKEMILLAGAVLLLGACVMIPKSETVTDSFPDPVPITMAELMMFGDASAGDGSLKRLDNVSAAFNAGLLAVLPEAAGVADKLVFAQYDAGGDSAWSSNWLGRYDFSGVAWDDKRAGTLIGPRHVVMARHYQRPKGAKLTFHNRQGQPVVRTLIDKESFTDDNDVTVGLLDADVTGCAVYPVLPAGYDWQGALRGTVCLLTDQERKVLLYPYLDEISDTYTSTVRFGGVADGVTEVFRERLITGDSGHPTFLVYGHQLVLLSTHWFGGLGSQGPNFSHERVQDQVRAAIARMAARQ